MNVSDAIRLKRAVRKFQDKPLPDDVIHASGNSYVCFVAELYISSSINIQDLVEKRKIESCLCFQC